MRYSDLISSIPKKVTESFVTTLVPDYGKRKPFDVFKNPSSKEWREIDNEGVRAFIVGDDIYAWTALGDLHANVHSKLSLDNKAIPVILYGDWGDDVDVDVTDFSKHTIWWHNAEVYDEIIDHPFLNRAFDLIEVDYYDSDIVGDWRGPEDEDEDDDY